MLNVELHIVTSFDAASSNSYDIVRKIKAYTDDEEMQETLWLIFRPILLLLILILIVLTITNRYQR